MIHSMNIHQDGVEIKQHLLPDQLLQDVIAEISQSKDLIEKHGIRNAEKKFKSIFQVAHHKNLQQEARKILGGEPQIVRVIFFDKNPDKNWLVSWHQDKTVALNQKFNCEGWGPWTVKDNTHHVQPPLGVLNKMITFRIHLDPSDEENGCLLVMPGSHKRGILKHSEINEITGKDTALPCRVDYGDTFIMRPHILHSSKKSIEPTHRRVIHIEYSSYKLPIDISWA